jgi:hypothetical protein
MNDEELDGCGVGAIVGLFAMVFVAVTVVMWVLR